MDKIALPQKGTLFIKGHGTLLFVEIDKDTDKGFNHLIGQTVNFEGKDHTVKAVESFKPTRNRKGEQIGLLLDTQEP